MRQWTYKPSLKASCSLNPYRISWVFNLTKAITTSSRTSPQARSWGGGAEGESKILAIPNRTRTLLMILSIARMESHQVGRVQFGDGPTNYLSRPPVLLLLYMVSWSSGWTTTIATCSYKNKFHGGRFLDILGLTTTIATCSYQIEFRGGRFLELLAQIRLVQHVPTKWNSAVDGFLIFWLNYDDYDMFLQKKIPQWT